MKNIQIIDGADNCTYDIFAISDEDFKIIFPAPNQDIEFNTDLFTRLRKDEAILLGRTLWKNRQNKQEVTGIHGTLFYDLDHKKKYYPAKQSSQMVVGNMNNQL